MRYWRQHVADAVLDSPTKKKFSLPPNLSFINPPGEVRLRGGGSGCFVEGMRRN